MNQVKLKKLTQRLWGLLEKYSRTDDTAMLVTNTLRKQFKEVMAGNVLAPLSWEQVPCGYFFTEDMLGKYKDLEEAYADYKVAITGGNDPLLEKIKKL